MLSRVADSIFWMNRYVERAENVARFIDVNQHLSLGFYRGFETQWEPLIHATGDKEPFLKHYDNYDENNVLEFLIFDKRNPNSIVSCLKAARENARSVRECLSLAMWEAINKCYLRVKEFQRNHESVDALHALLDLVKEQSQQFEGACQTTLSHGDAWNVSRLGRLIERADKTSRILDVKYYILLPSIEDVGSSLDIVQWTALLNSTSGLQMYRRKHGPIHPKKVVAFLILDRQFPRSMHFCLMRADDALRSIFGSGPTFYSNEAERLLGQMKSNMDYTTLDNIVQQGVHEFVDGFQIQLNQLGNEIHAAFFGGNGQKSQQSQFMYQ